MIIICLLTLLLTAQESLTAMTLVNLTRIQPTVGYGQPRSHELIKMGFIDFIKSILNPTIAVGGDSHNNSPRRERRGGVPCTAPFCGQMTVIDSHTLCHPCYKIANPDGPPPSRTRLEGYNRLIDISGVAPGGSEAELRSSLQSFGLDDYCINPLVSSPVFRSMMKW